MSKQAVKQIVQVLVHAQAPKKDEAILQPGRKKRKTTRRATKKPATKKPSTKPPPPPPSQKPRAPDGFISQVFGAPRPPPQFISAQYTNLYDRIQQIEKDSQLAKAIQRIEKLESKETPTAQESTRPPSVQQQVSRPPSIPLSLVSSTPSGSVASTPFTSRPPSVFELRQSAFRPIQNESPVKSGTVTPDYPYPSYPHPYPSNISPVPSYPTPPSRRSPQYSPQSAPNRANQPSVDVDGDGKEEEHLQPQQPSFRLAKSSSGVSPYQLPAQPINSSSSMFGETPDQEWTPEFQQAARAAGVSGLIIEEQPRAGEVVDIVTGIRVPPPAPPSPPRRRKIIVEDEEDIPIPPAEAARKAGQRAGEKIAERQRERDRLERIEEQNRAAAASLARENERLRRAKAVQPSKRSQRKKANE